MLCFISASRPTCGPVVPRQSVAENEAVEFTCSMTYRWHSAARQSNIVPQINVSFGWVQTPPMTTLPSTSASQQTLIQTMTVASAKKPEIPAQKCTLIFTFAGQSSLYSFANNAVSYPCISDPIPVRRKFLLPVHTLSARDGHFFSNRVVSALNSLP